jgi:hypothetical protein
MFLRRRTWARVLGTLNEYHIRLFVAAKKLDLGRGGIGVSPVQRRLDQSESVSSLSREFNTTRQTNYSGPRIDSAKTNTSIK